jgi:hypothetical protein
MKDKNKIGEANKKRLLSARKVIQVATAKYWTYNGMSIKTLLELQFYKTIRLSL